MAHGYERCGTPDPTNDDHVLGQMAMDAWIYSEARLNPTDVVIPVYFHIIRRDDGFGDVSDQQLFDQIDVLNQDYRFSRYRFQFAGADRTNNSGWASAGQNSAAEAQMKSALAKDVTRNLNVYISPDLPASGGGQILGWAWFPSSYAENNTMHGVIILTGTLPGGSIPNFNLGRTLTHEIGHYLGLYHTFEGECSDPNDGVADTPAHIRNFGRPAESTDTCPSMPGTDPVHNFMNYTNDDWLTQFTNGQYDRSYAQVAGLRPTLWASGQQNTSYLSNISTRLYVGTDNSSAIAGFIIAGSGSRSVLVRGSGPWLAQFGITPTLANPTLTLYTTSNGGTPFASNDDWKDPASNYNDVVSTGIPPAFDQESAIKLNLTANGYTAQLTPKPGTPNGVGIIEVYDLQGGTQPNRIINISTRGYVGSGNNSMIAGFIINGGTKQVLVRGIGPTLSQFGVGNVVSNPMISIANSAGQVVAANSNWSNSWDKNGIADASQRVGAFALTSNNEGVILANLAPGSYTVIVAPEAGSPDGIGIVEVWDVNAY